MHYLLPNWDAAGITSIAPCWMPGAYRVFIINFAPFALTVKCLQRPMYCALGWTSWLPAPWFGSKAAQFSWEQCWKKKPQILSSGLSLTLKTAVGLTETLEEPGANLPKAWGCSKPGRNPADLAEPGGTPAQHSGTWRNPAETWRNPAEKSKLKGGRVPPRSAGFRRLPLRLVPSDRGLSGCRQQGFCVGPAFNLRFFLLRFRSWNWYTANCTPCYCTPPRFNQVSARIMPSSWQTPARLAAIKKAPFTNARTLPKSACGKIPNKRASLFYFEIASFHWLLHWAHLPLKISIVWLGRN